MAGITAVIVAAGLGVRMGARGELTPKGLIKLGGLGLVPQSVATLQRWGGAERIVIVTGHLQEQYQATFPEGSGVELIYNPDYASTGSLRTLQVALEHVSGPIMILESDLIYAPIILDHVSAASDRFMVSSPTGAGDEVYTWVVPGAEPAQMDLISKDIAARERAPFGEMIGITCLSSESTERMRGACADVLAETPEAHYEDGLVALAQELPLECVLFDEVPWAEMDDEEMLARVKAEVWPQIQAARQEKWGSQL